MDNFLFKSLEHGEIVYLERKHYKELVDRFLQLQEVAKAAQRFIDECGYEAIDKVTWYDLDRAVAELRKSDSIS